jgi:transposase InsO family protein
VHIGVKKLGRFDKPGHRVTGTRTGNRNHGAGWEAVHVAIDDTTRLAYVEILPDERGITSVGFLQRATAWFAARGVTVQRDDRQRLPVRVAGMGSVACGSRCPPSSHPTLPSPHQREAERFIQIALREWAYAIAYQSSAHRAAVLPTWLEYYNHRRPHSAVGHKAPANVLNDD